MISSNAVRAAALGVAVGWAGCQGLETSVLYHPALNLAKITRPTEGTVTLQADPAALNGSVGVRVVKYLDLPLHLSDGTTIHARWFPREGAANTLLFCHGNAGDLETRTASLVTLMDGIDASLLVFDYPGYGRSEGEPSEAGLYAAADAAFDWLTWKEDIPPEQVVLFGESLGGCVAVDLASRRPCRALVLVKTFTSLPALVHSRLPVLPSQLVACHFNSLAKIPLCHRPVFMAHGTPDRVVPFAEGQRLFAAANEPKQFLTLPTADHNDPLSADFYKSLREFLSRTDPRPAALGRPASGVLRPS